MLLRGREGLGLQGSNKAEAKEQDQGLHLQSLCSQVPNRSLGRLRRLCWGFTQPPIYTALPRVPGKFGKGD